MIWLLLIFFGIISGFGDAQGFHYASLIWKTGTLDIYALSRSLIGFALGIGGYIFMAKSMNSIGIQSTELQTITWFVVTILCIGILSGAFLKWQRVDQAVAILVLIGVGWLLMRVG